MATDVAIPVESSSPVPNFEPSTYTPEEHGTWMKTGKLPTSKAESTPAKETPKSAESAPAEEAGAAEAAEVAPESATDPQQEKGKGKGADARKAQLAADIQESLDKRKTVQKEWDDFENWRKTKTDVAAAPAPAVKEAKVEKPVKPTFDDPDFGDKDGETFEQFQKRRRELRADFETKNAEYTEKLIQYSLAEDRKANEKARMEAETQAANKKIEDAWQERVEAAKTTHADFADVAFSKEVPISAVMDGFVLDSEVGPEILYYLGKNVKEAKAIAAMPPYKAARALVSIEISLSKTEDSPKADATPAKPVVPITKAAKPATDLKATNAAPVDELKAAIEAGDSEKFNAIQNARDVERRKAKG